MEDLIWRKSSYSGDNGAGCVEVATANDRVLVRDSRDPDGPILSVDRESWAQFVNSLR